MSVPSPIAKSPELVPPAKSKPAELPAQRLSVPLSRVPATPKPPLILFL